MKIRQNGVKSEKSAKNDEKRQNGQKVKIWKWKVENDIEKQRSG